MKLTGHDGLQVEGGGNEEKREKSWESQGFGRAPGGVDGGGRLGEE